MADQVVTESRTGIHIIGGFALAAVMGVALSLSPYFKGKRHGTYLTDLQSAAEGDLLFLARAEKDFKAKHGFYTTDFNALIIMPKVVIYKFGFARPSEPNTSLDGPTFQLRPELKDLDALKAALPQLDLKFSPVTKLETIQFDEAAKACPDCTATRDTFKALAVAYLNDETKLDIWTIDEKGEIKHLSDGLKK